ncbi:hypothetical protein Taro_040793 [Colocasia esculenta]|uniref:Uncharacterized protein n=1 Tax=Colocasia esculenta TaxID=4460 RepID=A0A843WU17_COLES|nr:hypothetical protein [Colocasia esculenta]
MVEEGCLVTKAGIFKSFPMTPKGGLEARTNIFCKGSVDTTIPGVDTMVQNKGRNVKKSPSQVDTSPEQVDTTPSSVDTL